MANIDPRIFRAYDIRGKAYEQLTEEACLLIGEAFGEEVIKHSKKKNPRVVVGRDVRPHSPIFEEAAIRGLNAAGCDVLEIGETPSPLNYFTICDKNLDGGVQITASHNPPSDNGIKLQLKDAEAFSGDDLQRLRSSIEGKKESVVTDLKPSFQAFDAVAPYLDRLQTMFGDCGKGMTVAVDAGNGIAGPVYTKALKNAGCKLVELFTEPDGTFPNHLADPSKHDTLKDLQAAVQKKKANVGFAFDGDGDRLGIVDEKATIRTADEILLLLARDHLSRNPGAPVIFTVSNSSILETEIKRLGGNPIMCKVGHSFVEHAMREYGAKLGGEQSGHFFCGENYYDFDDALVAALRVLKIFSDSRTTNHESRFSDLFSDFPKTYQSPEARPHCSDDHKADVIKRVTAHFEKSYPVNTLDGARIDFGDGAWAGIRQSNTSPCLSVCMEARNPQKLKEIESIVWEHLRGYSELKMEN